MSIRTFFENIATAIKEKNPNVETVTPAEMPDAIRAIQTGGGGDKIALGFGDITYNRTPSSRSLYFDLLQLATGSSYRTGALSDGRVYINTDPTKPRFSFGSSGGSNKVAVIGPFFPNGKKLKFKYFPVYWSTSYATSNLWVASSNVVNDYTPSGTIYGTVNVGGSQYSVNYWKNLYGNNVITDVQDDLDHPAWKEQIVDVSNVSICYIFFRGIDMDSFVQDIEWVD